MPVDVLIPEVGEGITTGSVLKLLVKVGDSVSEGQGLIELETDKALVEVPSSVGGVVEAILVKTGDKVPIGSAIVKINASADSKSAKAEAPKAEASKPAPAKAEVAYSVAPKGEAPKAEVPKAETPPAKAAPEAAPAPSAAPPAYTNGAGIAASPATRRLAREFGVDLRAVQGSGRGGRVTQEDVISQAKRGTGGGFGGGNVPALPDFSQWGEVERKTPNMVRTKTIEHMALSHSQVAPVTQFERADVTELDAARERLSKDAEKAGGKLTLTVFIMKALVTALKAYPDFNASLDYNSGDILLKRYYSFGIAVDTERGLLVPVLRNVDSKDIFSLARELGELGERARNGRSELSEFSGGSFTVSNQGSLGGAEFTPIVNWPEVAILGIGRSRLEAAVIDGQIVPRMMLPLGLSYDHRVVDGASAARFIKKLKDSLEDPVRLMAGY